MTVAPRLSTHHGVGVGVGVAPAGAVVFGPLRRTGCRSPLLTARPPLLLRSSPPIRHIAISRTVRTERQDSAAAPLCYGRGALGIPSHPTLFRRDV